MGEAMILWAFMAGTLVVLAGLMFIFKGWMNKRDAIMGGARVNHGGHGHHH